VLVLRATVKVTVPLPEPLGVETVIHGTALDAVQVHPVVVVTASACVPPVSATVAVVGETVNVQGVTAVLNVNWLETLLCAVPLGPNADTRDS
jgi:hypothetical protein